MAEEGALLGDANLFLREPGALEPVLLKWDQAVAPRRLLKWDQAVAPRGLRPADRAGAAQLGADGGVVERTARWIAGIALIAGFIGVSDRASTEPRFRPSLTVSEQFSDNIDLDPDDEQSAFIT